MTGVLVSIYLLYFRYQFTNQFQLESTLITLFTFLISRIIHKDRRRIFLSLNEIYSSQKEINSRFEQLEENITQIFVLCSCDFSKYYYISSGFERMFSISREILGHNSFNLIDFVHPGDKARVELELAAASVDHSYREMDFRTDYNNTSLWLRIEFFPIDMKNSAEMNRFALIIDDISSHKMAELKLVEAKSLDGEFAARIQKNLLFSNPILNIQDLDVAAESIPSMDVGGDFFDFYRFSDYIVDVIIADVMGKGMIASLLGAASKSSFMKSRLDLSVLENDIPPIEKIMSLTNQSLSPELIKMGKFITMQYARLNMKESYLSFIDSGHTSLLYYSARQKCCWSLKGWNMPMGFNPQEILIESSIPFERNDLFFFYSDGVTEAENEEGEQFGERRLNYVINNSAHLTSSQIMNKVRNLVFQYSSSLGFADDLTCIAMKIGNIANSYYGTEAVFPGVRESLEDVRFFTSDFLNQNIPQMSEDTVHSMVLAVNEAVANVIEHNYEKDSNLLGHEILIEAGKNEKICFFRLYYDGEDFEWTTFKAPHLSEFKGGGYGLFIMKEVMDSICYSTNIDGVQCLNMVKHL
jgi:sigma-B regulation protein RsbU (phosphoserine phosphatase)